MGMLVEKKTRKRKTKAPLWFYRPADSYKTPKRRDLIDYK